MAAMLLVTEVPLLRNLFDTTALNTRQWGLWFAHIAGYSALGRSGETAAEADPEKTKLAPGPGTLAGGRGRHPRSRSSCR